MSDCLPDDLERELALVHSGVCDCWFARNPADPGKACAEIRRLLRRTIQAALREAIADGCDTLRPLQSALAIKLRAKAKTLRESR